MRLVRFELKFIFCFLFFLFMTMHYLHSVCVYVAWKCCEPSNDEAVMQAQNIAKLLALLEVTEKESEWNTTARYEFQVL